MVNDKGKTGNKPPQKSEKIPVNENVHSDLENFGHDIDNTNTIMHETPLKKDNPDKKSG